MGITLAIIASLGFVPAMSMLGRMSGDDAKTGLKFVGRIPEIAFAFCIAFASRELYELAAWQAAIAMVIAWLAMETGHGNAYHMGVLRYDFPVRKQTLDVIVFPVLRLMKRIRPSLDIESRSPLYCWAFMGLKGLLIGAPVFPFGLALGVLWPLAYWINFVKLRKGETPLAEYLSGAFAGVTVAAALLWALLA